MATSKTAPAPEVPSFSYAQAAKGLAATNPKQTGTASPETKPEAKVDSGNNTTSSQNESSDVQNEGQQPVEGDSTNSNNQATGASTPSLEENSASQKEDEVAGTSNGSSDNAAEKQSSDAAVPEPSSQTSDEKTETNTEADPEKSSQKPKEAQAAPAPPVNVWQQRREAQEAKIRANPTLSSGATPDSKSSSPVATDSSKGGKKKGSESTAEDSLGSFREKKRTVDSGKSFFLSGWWIIMRICTNTYTLFRFEERGS